jgi:NAD(P)-dependent dehydrogenase (short-subunit alcohol dehydrogenase family)
MDLNIKGRSALVLGSSQGLGFTIARNLALEGASVTLVGRSGERLDAAAEKIRTESGVEIKTEVLDLSDAGALETWVPVISTRAIDILVNNGGGPPPGAIAGVAADVWRAQFETMVNAPFRITAGLLPGMKSRKWGRIVNVVSSGVVQPIPNLGISNTLRLSILGWGENACSRGRSRWRDRKLGHSGPHSYLARGPARQGRRRPQRHHAGSRRRSLARRHSDGPLRQARGIRGCRRISGKRQGKLYHRHDAARGRWNASERFLGSGRPAALVVNASRRSVFLEILGKGDCLLPA